MDPQNDPYRTEPDIKPEQEIEFRPPTMEPVEPKPQPQPQPQPQPMSDIQPEPKPWSQPEPEVIQPTVSPTPTPSDAPASTPLVEPTTSITPEPSPTPVQAPAPVTFGADVPSTGSVQLNSLPNKNKKKFIILAVVTVLVLIGAAGYVFAIYIPNKPENVWSKGLDQSGQVIEELISQTADEEKLKQFEKSELTANLEVNYGGTVDVKSQFDAKFDLTQADAGLKVQAIAEGVKVDLALDILSKIPEGKKFPNLYLKLAGLKQSGLESYVPEIATYDDKWLFLSSDYIESLVPPEAATLAEQTESSSYSANDVAEASRVLASTMNEYVFTADPEKAVLENREFVGIEDSNGVKAYHYKVGINGDNLVKFCNAVVDNLLASDATKKLAGSPSQEMIDSYKKDAKAECDLIKNEVKSEDSFDMWIDGKYKLIQKMRIYDGADKSKYVDIGQNYQGGDDIPIYIDASKLAEGFEQAKLTITLNSKSSTTKGELLVSGGSTPSDKYTAKLTAEIKPLAEELNIQAPAGAVNLEGVLNELGAPSVLGANTEESPSIFDLLPL